MKKYLFFLLLISFVNDILAQTLDKADYVIFNFVHHHHGSIPPHFGNFVDNYYWIVPLDSINSKSVFSITPLVVNAETQHEVDECARGNTANFFGLWEGASEKYINEIDLFTKLVNKHRKKIQTITLNWHNESSRKKEKIEVYAIPISGTFCKCIQVFYRGASKVDEFSELPFFIPFSDFNYNESFWESQEWKIVKYVDYSVVNFASLTPWGHQYKTGSLVKTSR